MVTVVMVEKRSTDKHDPDIRRRVPRAAGARNRSTRPTQSSQSAVPSSAASHQRGSPEQPPRADSANPAEPCLDASERFRRISICAYFKAEQRGFAPGHMWEDWLAAEREVDAAHEGMKGTGS